MAGMDEHDLNATQVARMMIRSFGGRAAAIMDRRAEDHVRAGEEEGADFWRRVAQAVREIEAALPDAAPEVPGGASAPDGRHLQ
jgi:hypothetical protein